MRVLFTRFARMLPIASTVLREITALGNLRTSLSS
jgi:hypothetical protein